MKPTILDLENIHNEGEHHGSDARMPRALRRALMTATLVLSDGLSLVLAGLIAVGIRILLGSILAPFELPILREYQFTNTPEYRYALPVIVLFLLVYAARGLYDPITSGPVKELQSISLATSLVFLVFVSISFGLRTALTLSRFVVGLSWALALGMIPLGRAITRSIFSRTSWWGKRVAIVHVGSPTIDFTKHLNRHPKTGIRPAVLIELGLTEEMETESVQAMLRDLRASGIYPKRIDCALFVFEGSPVESSQVLREFREMFRRILLVGLAPDQRLNWSGSIDIAGVPGLEIRHNLLDARSQIIKRIIDVVLSILALAVLLPFFILIAILIKIDSPGPAFFRQIRVGIGGVNFGMWKFRTMHRDAESMLEALLEADPAARAEWDEYQKLKDDPRITRVGKFLRRLSLDETPQFWNVLIGEMSIVGPRPYFPEQREAYGAGHASYIQVRPGITGLWQVSGRSQATFADRALIDEEYVRNWSIWFDLYILAKTPWVVLRWDRAF
jgi:Undecaprenyl-phosphate galactose phosphotransferase WbaP